MKTNSRETLLIVFAIIAGFSILGCNGSRERKRGEPEKQKLQIPLEAMIDSLAEVVSVDQISVQGYALVGGLNGTGSSECPPSIRQYLEKYIQQQFRDQKVNPQTFIESPDTAVVVVQGMLPTTGTKSDLFDVKVTALEGTQTTSLDGGFLWGAELMETRRLGTSLKPLATAAGPVYIDKIGTGEINPRTGYILGGGKVIDEYKILLALKKPDYRISNAIRNRLNGRFGEKTTRAVSDSQVELTIPAKYQGQKQRFISIVKAIYLADLPQLTQERIQANIVKLAEPKGADESEIELEAIGKESISELAKLLNSPKQEVRFRSARCLLNIGSDRGLQILRETAMDSTSIYRIEALNAIAASARQKDLASISRKLLSCEDFDVRLTAYEQLRKIDDISIAQKYINGSFYLEQIGQTGPKVIYVVRSGQPRIVLFGAPVICKDNIFAQTDDGNITINALPEQGYVSLIRKVPKRPDAIIELKSSFALDEIIERLCESPSIDKESGAKPGLGISYSDAILLLKQLYDRGAVQAEFRVSPLPSM